MQRIEALRLLDGLPGARGITRLPSNVAGTDHPIDRFGPPRETPLPAAMLDDLATRARPYMRGQVGRNRYLLDLCRHQVVVAPTGYGELGNRHATAWRAGTALVCQDLSHVEMMVPVEDRRNAAFCRPDLSDLRSIVEELLDDQPERERIASEGRKSFAAWAACWRETLYKGIEAHIRAALKCDDLV
ncbi:MAG: glycosyltransferase [Acidimicrobiales bacterium]